MKQLLCDFTTPEQSKRLLELGVLADSANLFYSKFECETFENRPTLCYDKKYSDIVPYGYEKDYLPCWSVGRLIKIAKICSKSRYALRGLFLFLEECEVDEFMSQVMDYFEICNYQFDFSKLEEQV